MRKILYFSCVFVLGFLSLASCTDVIQVPFRNETAGVDDANQVYAYCTFIDNPSLRAVEVRSQPVSLTLRAGLTAPCRTIADLLFVAAPDEDLVAGYNLAHETSFSALPSENVTLEDGGAIAIAPGDRQSYEFTLTVSSEGLQEGTYVLPFKMISSTASVQVAESDALHYLLFKICPDTPSAAKESGIVTICYIESGYNPLNAGEWMLTRSGKPLFDIVHLFAADIKFNEATGRVYVNFNSNIEAILTNRDKYIKPLQDKGIKVCLTFMPNGDGVGQSNLTDADIASLAAEIRAIVDTYGLDGVDFDEEHAGYTDNPQPGFEPNGPLPYEKLCYEVKRLLPDKLLTVYYIGSGMNGGFPHQIQGLDPGDFIDYSYYPYYGGWNGDLWQQILGMEKSQWGPHPIGFGPEGGSPQATYLRQVRSAGYGVQIVYNLVTKDGNASAGTYQSELGMVASYLYDDNVTHSGTDHEVDW